MALDDLNLEFEDEEEVKRKKNDAVQVDVDLEFHNPLGDKSRTGMDRPEPKAQGAPVKPAVGGPQIARTTAPGVPASNVKSINDARPQSQVGAVKRPAIPGVPSPTSSKPATSSAAPRVSGSSALQPEHDSFVDQELVEAREQLKKVEFESAVKVSVAEFKTELLSELNGDVKLLEHQINQLLIRINAKHPDLTSPFEMAKKLVRRDSDARRS
jgi:hypothetical protein